MTFFSSAICHHKNRKPNYHLYHDESQVDGFWHGILLVPQDSKTALNSLLQQVRQNTGYTASLGIKKLEKGKQRIYSTIEAWLLIAVAAMRSRTANKTFQIHYGQRQRGRPVYETSDHCFGLKFILFRCIDNHSGLSLLNEHAAKVETTFRVGLKGGMHYLGSIDNPIHISTMHFDGHKHYGRNIDKNRVLGRLTGLREYCSFDFNETPIHDHSSDHCLVNAEEYGDCQLLQLTDVLIGACRSFLGFSTQPLHTKVAHPVKYFIEAYMRGFQGYSNSRWYPSFWMSQCQVRNQAWEFTTLEKRGNQRVTQPELFSRPEGGLV
jgi:hypothetical protein